MYMYYHRLFVFTLTGFHCLHLDSTTAEGHMVHFVSTKLVVFPLLNVILFIGTDILLKIIEVPAKPNAVGTLYSVTVVIFIDSKAI